MAHILLIDDEPYVRDVLRLYLEGDGHTIIEARDGREALQHYIASTIELIITDLLMPEQDGLETIQELRRHAPQAKIIAMSGGGQSGLLDLLPIAAKLGAQQTLRKPLRRRDLLDAVQQVLQS